MQLSPFTQYYIRKLLNHYIESLNHAATVKDNVNVYLRSDLNELLSNLYPMESEVTRKMQELEVLVRLHQDCGDTSVYHYESLCKLEQKIFWLLGLKIGSILSSRSLPVTPEYTGTLFRFYQAGQIHEGMRYENELYGLVQVFKVEYRLRSYQIILALTEQRIPFILAVSKSRYSIWVSLRSPTYLMLLNQASVILDKILHIHSSLNGFEEALVHKGN
jgi:hypothetical protein